MSGQGPTLVSVLVPVLNEADMVRRAYDRIVAVFDALPDCEMELIFTDNHSTDATFAILAEIAREDRRVRVIRFARNYGYQRSLLHAYQHARGVCAVQLDCDLQDPPELIPEMLRIWRDGHQVVFGVRASLPDPPLVVALRRGFYRLASWLSEEHLPHDAGEFRLVDGCVLRELRAVRDVRPYVRGLISTMGFSQVGFPYDRAARTAGESKFPLMKMLELGIDGILNHSLVPLRLASAVGMVVGFCTMLLILGYLVGRIVFGQMWPAGFATTTILLLLGITLNAFFLGIIGEYLGRIFLHLKRPMTLAIEAEIGKPRTGMGYLESPFVLSAVEARASGDVAWGTSFDCAQDERVDQLNPKPL